MNDRADRIEKMSFQLIMGFVLVFLSLAIFGIMAYGLLVDDLQSFDSFWGKAIRSFRNDSLTSIMIFFTMFGQESVFLGVTVLFSIVMIYFKRSILALLYSLTVIGAWGLNELLKAVFARSRPSIEHLITVHGYSFPSGHAMISTACYGMLGYLISHHLKHSYKSYMPFTVLTILFIVVISLSRVYLGVHYTSDILAGISAGGAWLLVCIMIYKHLLRVEP